MDFVTGEKIQLLCDVFLGFSNDFDSNPFINEKMTHQVFVDFRFFDEYDNPKTLFCFGHRMDDLSLHIHKFKNPFILISHNSDYNILDCQSIRRIIECPNLIKLYGQNVNFNHEKIKFLPIGIANRMWEHGNPLIFEDLVFKRKSRKVYMSFKIETNKSARESCHNILKNKVPFLPFMEPKENISKLQKYEFSICPEGNGLDTHRLWESLFVKTVPILLKSRFIEKIKKKTGLPMVLLNSWAEFDVDKLPDYESFDFNPCSTYLSMEYYSKLLQKFI